MLGEEAVPHARRSCAGMTPTRAEFVQAGHQQQNQRVQVLLQSHTALAQPEAWGQVLQSNKSPTREKVWGQVSILFALRTKLLISLNSLAPLPGTSSCGTRLG